MATKKEFINVIIPHAKIITADYKGGEEGFERKVQRKRALVFGIPVDEVEELTLTKDGDKELISFPKRVDKQIYTTEETKENYIYLDFSGKVKVLDENTMTRTLGVVFDTSYMNAEYSDVTLNVSLSYNEEAKKYLARVNVIRIHKGAEIVEINNTTFDDELEFTTVTADGELIGSIASKADELEVIEG